MQSWRDIAGKDSVIILGLILCVFLLRLAQLDAYPIPIPTIQDEFSYLLGADTFASGRLTNPTHPLWQFFDAPHILSSPTMMTKYQPAASLFMALSQMILGEPYWGVVMGVGLLVGSAYWAVKAWTSNRTAALIVAIFLLFVLRAPHYWIDSYWGGAIVTLAAMLMLGAYYHVVVAKRYGYAWAGMAGLVLALLSRPYEGGLLAICLIIAALVHFTRHASPAERKAFIVNMIAPVLIVGGIFTAFQLTYNHAVTGHWLRAPYMEHEKQGGYGPVFILQEAGEMIWSENPLDRDIQEWSLKSHQTARQYPIRQVLHFIGSLLDVVAANSWAKFNVPIIILFIAAITLVFPMLGYFAWYAYRHPHTRVLLLALPVLMTGSMLVTWINAHYLGPYFSVLVVFLSVTLVDKYHKAPPEKARRILFASLTLAAIYLIPGGYRHFYEANSTLLVRDKIDKQLSASDAYHLIFVDQIEAVNRGGAHRYWAYNKSDIDAARVVWARYISEAENRKLIDYYPERNIWYIAPDNAAGLIPYSQHID